MSNLEKFAINPTNEFHVLRHFEGVDEIYKKTLIGEDYWYYDYSQKKYLPSIISESDIECALKTTGTKFYKNIPGIENPKKLPELIKEKFAELDSKDEIHWTSENENRRTAFGFQYNAVVGEMNCLLIDNLTEKDRKNIKYVLRSNCIGEDNIMVQTVSGVELLSTNKIYVDIFETSQLPFYAITSFPDCSETINLFTDDDNLVFVV